MGYTVKIRGRYWRPLGTLQHVQQEFQKAFPTAVFAVQDDPKLFIAKAEHIRAVSKIGVGGPLPMRLILRLGLLLSAFRRSKHPYVAGYAEGNGYAIEFFLGSGPIVRKVYVTLYGRDWEVPGRQCDQLIAKTGWVLKS